MRHANSIVAACLLLSSWLPSGSRAARLQLPKADLRKLLAEQVQTYDDWGGDFPTTLALFAQSYRLPIGVDLENAMAKANLPQRHFSKTTVAAVLTAIVSEEPGYAWTDMDGVINVAPQRRANSILDIRIEHLRLRDANPFQVHDAIVVLPEIKNWLGQKKLTEATGFAGDFLVGPNGPALPRVSIDLRDVTLQDALNSIIKSGLTSWSIGRWGDKNQYLSISVN